MMNLPRHPPATDHFEAALEESCNALIALEVINTFALDEWEIKTHVVHAINSLRREIAHLRAARAHPVSALAHGFVAGIRSGSGDYPASADPSA